MKKFGAILADPPWHYFASSSKQSRRATEAHYPTLSIPSIRALPVGELADTDCALFLWITAPMLPELPGILEAWGFLYKTIAFVWIKQNRKVPSLFWGMGSWTRANAEYCVLAVKGQPKRVIAAVHQVIISPVRSTAKSRRKPAAASSARWATCPASSCSPGKKRRAGTHGATR